MDTSQKIIFKEFRKVQSLGYIKSIRPDAKKKNDGAVGNTLERELGIVENNKKVPDFQDWEIKSQKARTKSWVSLFSLKPDHPERADHYMKEQWGKPDAQYPHIKCLRTSLYAHRVSKVYKKYNMRFGIDRRNKKIKLLVYDLQNKLLSDKVYWNFRSLELGSQKLKNLLFVKADHKIKKGKMYFKYTSAIACIDFQFPLFLEMLEKGVIRYDHRMGVYKSGKYIGKPHNHGGGLRIHSSEIPNMYRKTVNL